MSASQKQGGGRRGPRGRALVEREKSFHRLVVLTRVFVSQCVVEVSATSSAEAIEKSLLLAGEAEQGPHPDVKWIPVSRSIEAKIGDAIEGGVLR